MHTMAVGHGIHTAFIRDRKLNPALKTQSCLGMRRNDMKNVKCIVGKKKKKKKLVLLLQPR